MDLNERRVGRARDRAIDTRVLEVARRHLSRDGFEGMSLTAVASEAGTTRQALYRRWPSKAQLAAAVVTSIGETPAAAAAPSEPFDALVAELTDFARGVSMPGRLSLVGAMLQDTADPTVVARYRAHVIAPRRDRLRAILERARDQGLIDAGGDLEVALTMCTGSWYGRALAGDPPPVDWPRRAAALVWRAVGGSTPGAA